MMWWRLNNSTTSSGDLPLQQAAQEANARDQVQPSLQALANTNFYTNSMSRPKTMQLKEQGAGGFRYSPSFPLEKHSVHLETYWCGEGDALTQPQPRTILPL